LRGIFKNLAIYLLIVLIAISIIKWTTPQQAEAQVWNYSQIYKAVQQGQVEEVQVIVERDVYRISGTTRDGTKFTAKTVEDQKLLALMREKGVEVKTDPAPEPPWWTNLLGTFLPILLLVGLIFFIMQQTQGGGSRVMQFGKSRAKLHTEEKKRVTFDDVAGADEVKEELEEIIEFLKNPKKFNELGARIPKGVLLFGISPYGLWNNLSLEVLILDSQFRRR